MAQTKYNKQVNRKCWEQRKKKSEKQRGTEIQENIYNKIGKGIMLQLELAGTRVVELYVET